jgi:hypothetical protein
MPRSTFETDGKSDYYFANQCGVHFCSVFVKVASLAKASAREKKCRGILAKQLEADYNSLKELVQCSFNKVGEELQTETSNHHASSFAASSQVRGEKAAAAFAKYPLVCADFYGVPLLGSKEFIQKVNQFCQVY